MDAEALRTGWLLPSPSYNAVQTAMDTTTNEPQLTFFVELCEEDLDYLFDREEVLDFLAQGGHRIAMGMLDLGARRAETVRRLEARGIAVTAWLLLGREDGYWPNADNYPAVSRCYEVVRAWARRENLRLWRVGLDIEAPRAATDRMLRKPTTTALELLAGRRPTSRIEQAEQQYAELVARIQRDGRSVESYQFPVLIDERRCDSFLTRRTLGLVDVAVDAEVFMLYRSYFGHAGALSYFSQAPAIAVGVTGCCINADAPEIEPKIGWDELHQDMLAAARFSPHIYVFSLEGCVDQDMLQQLEAIDWSEEPRPVSAEDAERVERQRAWLQWILPQPWLWQILPWAWLRRVLP